MDYFDVVFLSIVYSSSFFKSEIYLQDLVPNKWLINDGFFIFELPKLLTLRLIDFEEVKLGFKKFTDFGFFGI